jgi:hypothetical protein
MGSARRQRRLERGKVLLPHKWREKKIQSKGSSNLESGAYLQVIWQNCGAEKFLDSSDSLFWISAQLAFPYDASLPPDFL